MIRVAVFDLDGTVLDGESPFILTKQLLRNRQIKVGTLLKLFWWGFRYRARLPQTESTPRELIFSVLTKQTVEEVDSEIMNIYRKRISKRVRPGALAELARCREEGLVPILASASFKPITTAIVDDLDFYGQVSTVMEEKDGHYTSRVVGVPVEGEEKLRLLTNFCNENFGIGSWEIATAYSDHYSDIPLLSKAQRPAVVDPDGRLERCARRKGWEIVDWN